MKSEVVFKQTIPLDLSRSRQEHNLHLKACDTILKFGFQKRHNSLVPQDMWVNDLVVWYRTSPNEVYPEHIVRLVILYTGAGLEKSLQWLDTVIHPTSDLVFHIFEARL